MSRMSMLAVWTFFALCAVPASARGDGAVLSAADLGEARERIQSRIHEERVKNPRMWKTVAAIDAWRSEGARRSRSQSPAAVGVRYRRLGASARWALADLAAFHAPERRGADDRSWRAMQLALIDAIGLAADPELAPLLRTTFEQTGDLDLQGAAAVGLGHLGGAELPFLLAHTANSDPRLTPAVRGLGMSRRPEAATALARLLDGATDETQAQAIAAALAEAGSAWAWATGQPGSAADGEAVRRTAAAALIRNYPRFAGPAVAEVEAALRRVDHPDTKALITAARAQSAGEAAARLDHLEQLAAHGATTATH